LIKDFASLHNHSQFSIADSLAMPEEMIKTAKAKGLRSIAITDHGGNSCHADFFLFGKKHGVRTIFGVEAYVIDSLDEWRIAKERAKNKTNDEDDDGEGSDDDADRDTNSKVKSDAKSLYRKGHMVILASSLEGLANLNQLVYKSYKYGFYSKPRMDKKMLSEHSKGLIATSACMGGIIALKVWDMISGNGTFQDVVAQAQDFERIFGKGRFFLELQLNEADDQRVLNDWLVKVHDVTGIPLTVTTDSHYTKPEEWQAQEILYMLRKKVTLATRGPDWDFRVRQLYIKSPEEMWQSFLKFGGTLEPKVAIEAMENTLLIDSLVENFEPDTHQRLPSLPYEDPVMELMKRSIDGLKKLGLAHDEKYKARLLSELKVIKDKGFQNYFLMVQRIIEEAKKTMLVGEGRGSSCGSLACYCLGITDLDSIKYDLMFERFLDPNRSELPDIDVDFEDVNETKELLRKMYGEDNVACLSTYGTFQVKGLLKDLGRIYDVDHNEINLLNRKIEKELKVLYIDNDKSTLVITLDDIKRVSPTFNKLVSDRPEMMTHFPSLYGRIRQMGRHAAGTIVGDNLPAETALLRVKDTKKDSPTYGQYITQAAFTEGIVNKNVSSMGFCKIDVLSIATLKIIHFCLDLIAKNTGKTFAELRETIRSKNMDLNDQKVLKHVFHDGNFAGIFQFTNSGIRRLAKQVEPDTFVDVSAICSIYRPGPLSGGFDKLYAHNKHHPEDITYDHPLLEEILKPTRSCLIFQEQLMKICNVLGKMSWKDVNAVRKILLKKDKSKTPEFVKSERDRLTAIFLSGCEENGLEKSKADKLWKNLLGWGSYGFNKSLQANETINVFENEIVARKEIKDIKPGDLLFSRDEFSGKIFLEPVTALHDHGELELIEFTFDDGSVVRCTPNHKFRTTTGEMLPISEIMARDLEVASLADGVDVLSEMSERITKVV